MPKIIYNPLTPIPISGMLHRSEGFPRTGYFIPGHVGWMGLDRFGRSSAAAFGARTIPTTRLAPNRTRVASYDKTYV